MNRHLAPLAAAFALVIAAAAFAPTPAAAFDATSTTQTNVDSNHVALHGYDPVAYFTAGKPTPGDAALAATHDGAVYHFASAENMKAFQADPARYLPQYGGFCAMGAALGKKFDVDPTQFRVVEGRLYLNKDAEVSVMWNRDVPGHIGKADAAWPRIASAAPKSL